MAVARDDAVIYTRIAAALDPRSAIINNDYAEMLARAGRTQEAVDRFEFAIEIDPQFATAYDGLGGVLHRTQGRVAEAIPFYEAWLVLTRPGQVPTFISPGRLRGHGRLSRQPRSTLTGQCGYRQRGNQYLARLMLSAVGDEAAATQRVPS